MMLDYHRRLLADDVRMSAYREAIHRVVQSGDVVVDIGCGSGVLSFLACDAGAARVYAIEQNHMSDVAQLLARHRGLGDRVTVIHAESTKVELPERADVLVTETMGAFGFNEGIVGIALDARRRFLREGACIVPRRLALFAAPVQTEDYEHLVAWWSSPELAPLRLYASNALHHVQASAQSYLAAPTRIADVDLTTIDSTVVNGRARFVPTRDCALHGFAIFFEAELADGVTLSNRDAGATHWSQGFLALEQPINVTPDAAIELDLETDDGKSWCWRGAAGDARFDQTTWFSMPRCIAPST